MWFASAIYGEAHMTAGDTTTISGGDDGDKVDDDDGDDNQDDDGEKDCEGIQIVKAYYLSKDELSSTITTRQLKTSNSCEDKTIPQWGFQL